jgi:hypothetical protein
MPSHVDFTNVTRGWVLAHGWSVAFYGDKLVRANSNNHLPTRCSCRKGSAPLPTLATGGFAVSNLRWDLDSFDVRQYPGLVEEWLVGTIEAKECLKEGTEYARIA